MFKLSFIPVPGQCRIATEECSAENNTVTVAWQQPTSSGAATSTAVDGYVLELDNGTNGGVFKVGC